MKTTTSELATYFRLLAAVHPLVSSELKAWTFKAQRIPDPELRHQALSRLIRKRFHCVGGASLALLHRPRLGELVKAIVAVQTISDYLDNLCDRARASRGFARPVVGRTRLYAVQKSSGFLAYMRLHEALQCALDPGRQVSDYYGLYPVCHADGDGGYLSSLVEEARRVVGTLPGYANALSRISEMALWYSELQSIKHLSSFYRDELMREWFEDKRRDNNLGLLGCDSLKWWEFAAATGSTLGIFSLMCGSAGAKFDRDHAEALFTCYFPYVCGLHILLDYLIDLEEDKVGGDLNFVACYESTDEAVGAIERFVQEGLERTSKLPSIMNPGIHRAVVRGLLAMYLSDSKVAGQGMDGEARRLLSAGGGLTLPLGRACRSIRRVFDF
jgi:tetraprenyl-beta-curcumene synthase